MTDSVSAPAAFAFHVGEARVEFSTTLPEVAEGLWAVWRSAREPMVPVRQRHALSVGLDDLGQQVEVSLEGRVVARGDVAHALPIAERALYEHIPGWFEADRAVLHGALLAGPRACLLLVGESGAGKSSLSWSGVQRGYQYGGDEIIVSDGRLVWGVARAVLFDPTRVGNPLPEVAAEADRGRYRFTNWYGNLCFLPICAPPQVQVLREPRSLADAHIVLLSHGEGPCFEPASSLEVLAALHRECRGDVGLLVPGLSPGRCHRLRWQALDWAWQQLAPLLGRNDGPGPSTGRTADAAG